MPLLTLQTSLPVERASAERLLLTLSREVAQGLGKPESYVATSLSGDVPMSFGGSMGPACLVEVANIGKLSPELTRALSTALCEHISQGLSVPKERIYVRFFEVEPRLWGHSAGTFG